MYSFHQFQKLPFNLQVEQLSLHGISLDLVCFIKSAEAVLFAYRDFYIELLVVKHTDEILSLRCLKSTKRLEPYLQQINIAEITALLA